MREADASVYVNPFEVLEFSFELSNSVQKFNLDRLLVNEPALESLNFVFKFLRPGFVVFMNLISLPRLMELGLFMDC